MSAKRIVFRDIAVLVAQIAALSLISELTGYNPPPLQIKERAQ